MNASTEAIRSDINKTVADLKTLRDEVRVKIHLAGMDARQTWQDLQPRLRDLDHEIERGGDALTETVQQAATDARDAVRRVWEQIRN